MRRSLFTLFALFKLRKEFDATAYDLSIEFDRVQNAMQNLLSVATNWIPAAEPQKTMDRANKWEDQVLDECRIAMRRLGKESEDAVAELRRYVEFMQRVRDAARPLETCDSPAARAPCSPRSTPYLMSGGRSRGRRGAARRPLPRVDAAWDEATRG